MIFFSSRAKTAINNHLTPGSLVITYNETLLVNSTMRDHTLERCRDPVNVGMILELREGSLAEYFGFNDTTNAYYHDTYVQYARVLEADNSRDPNLGPFHTQGTITNRALACLELIQ